MFAGVHVRVQSEMGGVMSCRSTIGAACVDWDKELSMQPMLPAPVNARVLDVADMPFDGSMVLREQRRLHHRHARRAIIDQELVAVLAGNPGRRSATAAPRQAADGVAVPCRKLL